MWACPHVWATCFHVGVTNFVHHFGKYHGGSLIETSLVGYIKQRVGTLKYSSYSVEHAEYNIRLGKWNYVTWPKPMLVRHMLMIFPVDSSKSGLKNRRSRQAHTPTLWTLRYLLPRVSIRNTQDHDNGHWQAQCFPRSCTCCLKLEEGKVGRLMRPVVAVQCHHLTWGQDCEDALAAANLCDLLGALRIMA